MYSVLLASQRTLARYLAAEIILNLREGGGYNNLESIKHALEAKTAFNNLKFLIYFNKSKSIKMNFNLMNKAKTSMIQFKSLV